MSPGRPGSPRTKSTRHSSGDASALVASPKLRSALLLGRIALLFPFVAPCQLGPSPLSVLARLYPRTAGSRFRHFTGLAATLLALPFTASAQSQMISGRVWSADGLLLGGATVRLLSAADSTHGRVSGTDRLGYFSFSDVPPGGYVLTVSRLGFARYAEELAVAAGTSVHLDIELVPRAIELDVLEVEGERSRARVTFEQSAGETLREISGEAMKALPGLAETDPIRAVEMLPGVSTVSDFSAAYNVRGGSADQNLILLDGVPIFSPFHSGGMFSVFNADMVERAELRAGGFPAEFGGHVSSVLTVETDVGDGVTSVDAGMSLLAARVAVDGSLPRDVANVLGLANSRWRVSGRRSYHDMLVKPWREFPYRLVDLQGALEAWTGGGDRLQFTAYTGGDVFDRSDVRDNPLPLRWSWGNDAAGGTWTHPMRGGRSVDVRASHSRYAGDFEFVETGLRFRTSIQETAVRADLELRPTAHTLWKSGVAVKWLEFENSARATGTVLGENAGSGWENAVYTQVKWDPNPRWLLEGGLRVDRLRPDRGGHETTVSPRFAARRFIRDRNAAVHLAVGRYSQFRHSVRDEELPLGIDLWVLAGAHAPPVVSDQLQLGVEGFFGEDEWFASLEGYFRTFDGVIMINAAEDPDDHLDDFVSGDGWAYGADLFVKRNRGATTGWVTVSLLKTERTFPDIRSGQEPPPDLTYPPVFDRRVDIDLVLRRALGWWGLEAGLRANFGTGVPYTRVAGQFDVYGWHPVRDELFSGERAAVVLGPRNGERYPARHRFDISFRKPIQKRWGRMTPYLSIHNLYNRKNVLLYSFDYGSQPPTRSGVSMIPFLPTLGVDVSF